MRKQRKFLRQLIRPYRFRLAGLSLLMMLQSFLQVSMALLIRFVIDTAREGSGGFALWAALLALDLLGQAGIYVLLNWYTGSTTDRMVASLRNRLLRSAVYSADARLQDFHSGALLSRAIEDVYTVCDGFIQAMPSLLGQGARLLGAFVAVALLDWRVALVLLAAGVVAILGIAAVRPILKDHHRKVRSAEENIMAAMQEDLQQLELIQSIQVQEPVAKHFLMQQHTGLTAKHKRRIWTVSARTVVNTATLLGTGVLLLWGADRVAEELLTYGALTALLQLLSQFRGPVVTISGLWTRFTAIEVAAERLAPVMTVPKQRPQKEVSNPKAVVFENVTFRYPGDEVAVVENFSLRLPLEGWVSLSGISGRGKTTLFKLILGLYEPQKGRVYLETDEGKVLCTPRTRHLFAYVPQDYALFSGTVRENLLLVAPDAEEQQLDRALKIAAAEFIGELPNGLDTRLGENNTGLSKGQLQRLAIARAVLMERKILLLDECTSALDADNETQVLKNLHASCENALLVTHRPQSLEQLKQITPVMMQD